MVGLIFIGILSFLFMTSSNVFGFAGVCDNGSAAPSFRESNVDPGNIPNGCFVIPENQTAAQVALWNSVSVVNKVFLRVTSGLLEMRPQAEIDAIIASRTSDEAEGSAASNELTNNNVCNTVDYSVVETRIDSVANIADAKTVMKKLARCIIAIRRVLR